MTVLVAAREPRLYYLTDAKKPCRWDSIEPGFVSKNLCFRTDIIIYSRIIDRDEDTTRYMKIVQEK